MAGLPVRRKGLHHPQSHRQSFTGLAGFLPCAHPKIAQIAEKQEAIWKGG